MTDIIQRLQDASEGSRELDVEIAIHAKWDHPSAGCTLAKLATIMTIKEIAIEASENSNSILTQLPAYTTIIDAAMTLVPDGAIWRLGPVGKEYLFEIMPATTITPFIVAQAETPALAICAADLKE